MGACAMVRMGRSTRGRGRGFYPVTYGSPPPRYMYQTSPTMPTGSATPAASPQFYQTTPTTAYFDAASPKRSGEEQMNVPALVEVAHPSTAGMTIKSTKNSVQVAKVNWLYHEVIHNRNSDLAHWVLQLCHGTENVVLLGRAVLDTCLEN